MMRVRQIEVIAVLAASMCLGAAGCLGQASNVEENMGSSTASARELMLRPPGFTAEGEVADTNMSGTTARGVIENYHENQTVEAQERHLQETGIIRVKQE